MQEHDAVTFLPRLLRKRPVLPGLYPADFGIQSLWTLIHTRMNAEPSAAVAEGTARTLFQPSDGLVAQLCRIALAVRSHGGNPGSNVAGPRIGNLDGPSFMRAAS